MSKILFTDPSIFRGPIATPVPDPTPIVVPGSAQGGVDPRPCSFDEWLQNFRIDLDGDLDYDFDDYCKWWIKCGFSSEAWDEFNSEPFPTQNP